MTLFWVWTFLVRAASWAASRQNQQTGRPVWSESSLSAWRKLVSLATHWAHSEDSDQTGRIWQINKRDVLKRGFALYLWEYALNIQHLCTRALRFPLYVTRKSSVPSLQGVWTGPKKLDHSYFSYIFCALLMCQYSDTGSWNCLQCTINTLCHVRSFRYEPRHDKTNKVTVRPAKTQIWVFAGRTVTLLVLSCRSSYVCVTPAEVQGLN